MKLPSFRRLFKNDYPDEFKQLVEQLSVSINYGFEVLYDTLNNKVSFRDNIANTVAEVDVQVNSSGIPIGGASIKLKNTNILDGIIVLKSENLTNSTVYPTGGIHITFTQRSDIAEINHITGLPTGNVFRLRLSAITQ